MRSTLPLVLMIVLSSACKKQPPVDSTAGSMQQVSVPIDSLTTLDQAMDRMAHNFSKVHFALDKDTLDETSKAALSQNVAIMTKFPSIEVEVQGHADEQGTTEYNLALGQRRAEAIRTYMTKMGVPAGRVQTVSYGEERPAVSGSDETAWSENRRAEFRIISRSTEPVVGTVN